MRQSEKITMQISYTANAFGTLIQLVNYIESENTKGAGLCWLNRYELFLQKILIHPQQIKLCNNLTFNQLNLRCIYFNDWICAAVLLLKQNHRIPKVQLSNH